MEPMPSGPTVPPAGEPVAYSPRRMRAGPPLWPFVALLFGAAIGAGAWYLLRPAPPPPPPPAPVAEPAPAPKAEPSAPALPSSDETDPLVRKLVGPLSSNPLLAEWLNAVDLVRRF